MSLVSNVLKTCFGQIGKNDMLCYNCHIMHRRSISKSNITKLPSITQFQFQTSSIPSCEKTAFRFGSLISTGKLVPLLATEPELEGGHRTSAPWMKRMGFAAESCRKLQSPKCGLSCSMLGLKPLGDFFHKLQ